MNTELASISIVDYEKKRYNYIGDLHYGLAVVRKAGTYGNDWGFINAKGEEVIPCKYDYAENFIEGLACVNKNGYYGYINTKGEEVIPCQFIYAGAFKEGLAYVNRDGYHGFIDTKGKNVISLKNNIIASDFSNGLACIAHENGKKGYINIKGEEVIPCKYDYALDFQEGLACVKKEETGYFGYINTKGEEVTPFKYIYAESFSEGLACVKIDLRSYSYINTKGEEVIFCQFPDASDFSEGLARIRSYDGKYGYINNEGNIVIPCRFSDANNFKNGLALVIKNNKKFYIDKKGNLFDRKEIEKRIEPQQTLELVDYYSDIKINNRKNTLVAETKLDLIKQKQKFLLDFQNEIEQYKNSLQQELEAEQTKTKGQLKK